MNVRNFQTTLSHKVDAQSFIIIIILSNIKISAGCLFHLLVQQKVRREIFNQFGPVLELAWNCFRVKISLDDTRVLSNIIKFTCRVNMFLTHNKIFDPDFSILTFTRYPKIAPWNEPSFKNGHLWPHVMLHFRLVCQLTVMWIFKFSMKVQVWIFELTEFWIRLNFMDYEISFCPGINLKIIPSSDIMSPCVSELLVD